MTTTQTPAAPTSMAEAIEAGIAAANAGNAPPPPVVDDSGGGDDPAGGTNDNSTVDPATDPAVDPNAGDGGAGGDPASTDGSGDGQGDEGVDPKAGTPDPDGGEGGDDADADAAARAADPKAGKTAKPKPGEPGDTDPLTAPIPNALKPATKERIRTLVDRTKTAESRAATAEANVAEYRQAILDTKATPKQYVAMLDYLTMVNSNDSNRLKVAANFLIRELHSISRMGGFRIPGVTTYAGHADLEAAVKAGKITEEYAEEVAATRSGQQYRTQKGAAETASQAARQEYQTARERAQADMVALEEQWVKADPMMDAKRPLIVAMLNTVIRGNPAKGVAPLHPSKWLDAMKDIYANLPAMTAPRKAPVPGDGLPSAPKNTPIGTRQPAGSQAKTPTSMLEAIEQGISLANGG